MIRYLFIKQIMPQLLFFLRLYFNFQIHFKVQMQVESIYRVTLEQELDIYDFLPTQNGKEFLTV